MQGGENMGMKLKEEIFLVAVFEQDDSIRTYELCLGREEAEKLLENDRSIAKNMDPPLRVELLRYRLSPLPADGQTSVQDDQQDVVDSPGQE
jgi:hypothetical protein